ncbi:MAG: hypothetical protein HY000_02460, partial [Planctomycetes bacterium]|nr:hypothetical protein [Planctomycetota bacterium]
MSQSKLRRRPRPRRLGTGLEQLEERCLLAAGDTLQQIAESAIPGAGITQDKPQSKLWFHDNTWFGIWAETGATGSGIDTWVHRLDGLAWTKVLNVSKGKFHADVTPVGDGTEVQVLLFRDITSKLASLEYVPGTAGSPGTYKFWTLRPGNVDLPIDQGLLTPNVDGESATMIVDSTGRMWIEYDMVTDIQVRYSDRASRYAVWSNPITVASNINPDDIGAIVALPNNSIGVFWSDQTAKRFHFRTHTDGTDATVWNADELAAPEAAIDNGFGMADDHLNVHVGFDGTVYAAVKTGYTGVGLTQIGLLVRRPNGQWDPVLYNVDSQGTRPTMGLDDINGRILVFYSDTNQGGSTVYRESVLDPISFGPEQVFIAEPPSLATASPGLRLNDASTTKQNFYSDLVVVSGTSKFIESTILNTPFGPNRAPLVTAGLDQTVSLTAKLQGSVTDDGRPQPPAAVTTLWTKVSGPDDVTFADPAAVDTAVQFGQKGTYVLRLTADDGLASTSDDVTIIATNLPPVVNAGPDQTSLMNAPTTLSATASDDGVGIPNGVLTTTWSKVSGPGDVLFGDP